MKEAKTIYEQLGGTYREENGNLVPDVELPEQKPIGKYGQIHLDYLKQHRRGRYSTLLGEGRLNAYLSEIDEHLKATDQMQWVQMMNSVRAQAEEIILNEFVFACHEERKAIDELLSELQKGEDSAKKNGYVDLPTVEKILKE